MVTDFSAGEWLRYTVSATGGHYDVNLVGSGPTQVSVNGDPVNGKAVTLLPGTNTLVVKSMGASSLRAIKLTPAK